MEKRRRWVRERESEKNTVSVMCGGVVLHAYKPAAYLALLSPKKVSSYKQKNAHMYTL